MRFRSLALALLVAGCSCFDPSAEGGTRAAGPGRAATRAWGAGSAFASATVYSPFRDSLGRIWIGTTIGPAYLDGPVIHEFMLPPEAGTPRVRAVLETRDGALWFGTEGAGLWRFHRGEWRHYDRSHGQPFDSVNCLLEAVGGDGRPTLWVGTRSGVAVLTGDAWRTYTDADGLPGQTIWKLKSIATTPGVSEIWAGTDRGVAVLRHGRWDDITERTALPSGRGAVNDILAVPSGANRPPEIWLSCWGVGLVHGDGTRWALLSEAEGIPSRNPTDLALSVAPDGSPRLWVATYDRGLFLRDRNGWRPLDASGELSSIGIYGLLAMPGGRPDVWLGTRGLGLLSVDLSGWRTVDEREGLPALDVQAFSRDASRPGGVWVGTSRGLARWYEGTWTPLPLPATLRESIVSAVVSVSDRAGQERLWVGTSGGLALREGERWTLVGQESGLPMTRVRAMVGVLRPQATADVWVAFDRVLARHRDGAWTLHDAARALPADVVSLSYTPRPGGDYVLWLVLANGAVCSFEDGRWRSRMEGLEGLHVTGFDVAVRPDGTSTLWAGTRDGVLARLRAGDAASRWDIFALPPDITRANRTIWTIQEDRQNRLYLALSQSYIRLTLDTKTGRPLMDRAETFTMADGLPAYVRQTARALPLLDDDGRVWMGTPKGAVVIDPSLEAPLPPLPALRLTRVTADGRELPTDRRADLSFRTRHLRVEFVLPHYDRPDQIRYQSRLEGLEEEAGAWGPEPMREFTGLRSGTYVLEIAARDHAGRISRAVAYPFTVAPSPWATWWASIAYVVLLVAGVAGTVRWRSRALQREKRELERMVAERTDELRHRNEELAEARDRAMAATRAKSEFLANMSHEIRTPMNAVIGFSKLGVEAEAPPVLRDYFRKIWTSGHSLLSIVNDILDFSKIEAGKLTFEQVPFSLPQLLEQVMDLFSLEATRKGLTLDLKVGPGVPTRVVGDPVRVSQILRNLVANAVKFTAAGSVNVGVEGCGPEARGVRLRFAVEDTGIGLTAEQCERLFQPFSQADTSTTRRFGGTGLGLAISKFLVEKMDGEIGVESEPGRGSRFTFTLRLQPAADAAGVEPGPFDAAGPGERPQPPEASGLRGLRVLLAEDNVINQEVAVAFLRRAGVEVDIAATGAEAVRLLDVWSYDAVLMDVQMPEMDGSEATARIREKPGRERLPIIAMTAHSLAGAREECLAAGMNDFVSKPIDEAHLLAVLARWTGRSGGSRDDMATVGGETWMPGAAVPDRPRRGVIDRARLVMQLNGEEAFAAELTGLFRDHYHDHGTRIRGAIDSRDWRAAARLTHAVKGVAGTLCADGLHRSASELESALAQWEAGGGAGDAPPELRRLLDRFVGELDRAVAECRRLAEGTPS